MRKGLEFWLSLRRGRYWICAKRLLGAVVADRGHSQSEILLFNKRERQDLTWYDPRGNEKKKKYIPMQVLIVSTMDVLSDHVLSNINM